MKFKYIFLIWSPLPWLPCVEFQTLATGKTFQQGTSFDPVSMVIDDILKVIIFLWLRTDFLFLFCPSGTLWQTPPPPKKKKKKNQQPLVFTTTLLVITYATDVLRVQCRFVKFVHILQTYFGSEVL